MEHFEVHKYFRERKVDYLTEEQQSLLYSFAETIWIENEKYNLTGHDAIEEIMEDLVLRSIEPMKEVDVPRGTFFADLGTGAGVPGIPLAIASPGSELFLFDSNMKKIGFIESFIKKAGLSGVSSLCGRIEDFGREFHLREKFDFVVSRAMGGPYMCCELGAPFMKRGAFLYLFSSAKQEDLSEEVLLHCRDCGLSAVSGDRRFSLGFGPEGLLFEKTGKTDDRYPRRFSVIRRESRRCSE